MFIRNLRFQIGTSNEWRQFMKVLFQSKGSKVDCVDLTRRIISIDGKFVNELGEEIQVEENPHKSEAFTDYEEDGWYRPWMDYAGLDEPLKSESAVEPVCEIDDMFGQYGFKNKAGEFVIEPQYAYAHEFTNGLAAVNLGRTWYRTEEGKRYYENHYGYIDSKGKAIIGFQYDDAHPFNKYGVAVVYSIEKGYMLIDQTGAEIPGARFDYISPYQDYKDRFLEFAYVQDRENEPVGIYDTKERKILLEPSVDSIMEWEEDCILVDVRGGEYGINEIHEHYINGKGEIIYPWLYGKGFALVRRPDGNNVAAVAIAEFTELTGNPRSYFQHNGKKYDRKFEYGLYSSKGKYIILPEYEKIEKMGDNIWVCYNNGEILVVETEKGD